MYDGDFLKITRKWWEEITADAGIVANQHFSEEKKFVGVHFYVKKKKGNNDEESESEIDDEREEDDTEMEEKQDNLDLVDLSLNAKKETSYNHALYRFRARIEFSFEQMKTIFKILATHWQESKWELDNMVWVAVEALQARREEE